MKKITATRAIRTTSSVGKLNMGCPFGEGGWSNLHRVGADDADDDDLRARGEVLLVCNGFVFEGAVEAAHVDLPRPDSATRDRQVHRPVGPDGALDADGAVDVHLD